MTTDTEEIRLRDAVVEAAVKLFEAERTLLNATNYQSGAAATVDAERYRIELDKATSDLIDYRTKPPSPDPVPLTERPIDAGILREVETLQAAGVETFESCQGGEGHSYPEPTVCFHGPQSEGFRALSVALQSGLKVTELRRYWSIQDREPVGPHWQLIFQAPCKPDTRIAGELDREEAAHFQTIGDRDHREQQIAAIYKALGGEHEWSNLHDLGDEALELAQDLMADRSDTRIEVREEATLDAVRKVWCEHFGQALSGPAMDGERMAFTRAILDRFSPTDDGVVSAKYEPFPGDYPVEFDLRELPLSWLKHTVVSIYPDGIERHVAGPFYSFSTACRVRDALIQHYRNGFDMGWNERVGAKP